MIPLTAFVAATLAPVSCVEYAGEREGDRFHSMEECSQILPLDHAAHLGPAYTRGPAPLPKSCPVRNYLMFDVDANDYPRRDCISEHPEKEVCQRCWPLVVSAVDGIMHLMKEDFGASDPLITVTGGRGCHLRYFDPDWTTTPPALRQGIAKYISREGRSSRMAEFMVARGHWDTICQLQGWTAQTFFHDEKSYTWELYLNFCRSKVLEIVANYAGIRIDEKVTAGLNHLLRMPFSKHPRTGKLCLPVPFDRLATYLDHPISLEDATQVLRHFIGPAPRRRRGIDRSGESSGSKRSKETDP